MLKLRRSRKLFAEINVTPLVDVTLVLLIIFMVTTPLVIQSGITVNLPPASRSKELPQPDLLITISAAGQIFIDEQPAELHDLRGRIREALLTKRHGLVVINADESVRHGLVIRVMDAAKLAGARRLAVATRRGGE